MVIVVERAQIPLPANTSRRRVKGMLGLDPREAFLFFGIDVMVFAGGSLTLAHSFPLELWSAQFPPTTFAEFSPSRSHCPRSF